MAEAPTPSLWTPEPGDKALTDAELLALRLRVQAAGMQIAAQLSAQEKEGK
jgi:DNA repair protein RadC